MKTTTGYNTTKSEATAMGEHLLELVRGTGFKLRVWENLGWHYCVENDFIRVDSHIDMKYCASPKPHYSWFGLSNREFTDPNVAIKRMLGELKIAVSEPLALLHNATNSSY